MIRWKYVVPRLIVLLITVVAAWFGVGPLLRWTIIYGGQRLTETRVEVGHVAVRIGKSQIEVSDLCVVDSEHPQRNLFEADRMLLDVETHAALRRKFVIHRGVVEGVRLYGEREEAAILPEQVDKSGDNVSIVGRARQRGTAWLESSADKLQQDLEGDLHTVQLARELRERWPQEYETLRQQGRRIESQGQQLKEQAEQLIDDPLGNLDQLQPALNRVDVLRRDVVATRAKMTALRRQIREDRLAIARARRHDMEYLREKLHIDALDAQSLNEYLLGPVWSGRVETAINWIRRSRAISQGHTEADDDQHASRGISAIFPGYHASPDFLVQRLLLKGTGTVENQPFSFRATVADLTHQPSRHSTPTTIDVQAEGAVRVLARAIMDRRTNASLDRFLIEVPAVPQSARTLGERDKLAVEIAAGVASVEADVRVAGEQLDGWIAMRQPDLSLTPVLSQRYSRFINTSSLSELAEVRQMDAKLQLGGTLTNPSWKLESNLGTRLAGVLNSAVGSEVARRRAELSERGEQLVSQELDGLQERLSAEHGQVLRSLEIGDRQLQMIRTQLMTALGSPEKLIGQGRELFERLR